MTAVSAAVFSRYMAKEVNPFLVQHYCTYAAFFR